MSGHVFLIGFMGSGKSTVAPMVGSALGRPVLDLDSRISEREGTSIRELFATVGETGFREAERDALQEAVAGLPSVIACGGGIVMRGDNREIISKSGTAIYLQVALADILKRVRPDGTRPLLATSAHDIGRLLEERLPLYEAAADVTVDSGPSRAGEVAAQIVEAVRGVEAG